MPPSTTPVQRPTVYDGSFGVKVDDGRYADIVGHLFTEFLKSQTEGKKPAPNARAKKFAQEFVEFARQYLDANPPLSQTYIGTGIAVKLQNGVIVTFSTKDATVVAHRDESIALNRPKSQPGQHGISDMGSIPITTGQTKVQDARTQGDAPDQKQAAGGKRAAPARGPRKR